MWKFWKCTEICFESGPQLILQLYILEQSERDLTSISGKVVAIITCSSMPFIEGKQIKLFILNTMMNLKICFWNFFAICWDYMVMDLLLVVLH